MAAFDVDVSGMRGAGGASDSFFPFDTPSAQDIERERLGGGVGYDSQDDDDDVILRGRLDDGDLMSGGDDEMDAADLGNVRLGGTTATCLLLTAFF
jgi:hypothetical protein